MKFRFTFCYPGMAHKVPIERIFEAESLEAAWLAFLTAWPGMTSIEVKQLKEPRKKKPKPKRERVLRHIARFVFSRFGVRFKHFICEACEKSLKPVDGCMHCPRCGHENWNPDFLKKAPVS